VTLKWRRVGGASAATWVVKHHLVPSLVVVTKHRRDTMLFTDNDIVIFAIASSAIALVLAVLLVSRPVEQRIERLELKIRQAMCG